MFFLNLSPGEFFTLLGTLGGLVATLYLLDRARRKKVVSTLRFWTSASTAEEQQTRRRIREPWSLTLQIAALLLLLLAIAQLQLGTRDRRGRDHVLLLDTGSWSGEKTASGLVLDREKQAAQQYLAALPKHDRVQLVRADALSTPATSFTSDRSQLTNSLNDLRPGYSALNIEQALTFARQAQSWSGGQPGEIVYIGPSFIGQSDSTVPSIPNLRVIPIPIDRENCGIRRIAVTRSDDANGWRATIALKNYGAQSHTIHLQTQFAGTAFTPRLYALKPGQEIEAEYNFVTNTAGDLIAQIAPADALAADDRATLHLPRSGSLRIAVYTNRPNILKPLLEADRRLAAQFFAPTAYQPNAEADIMLLDRFAPPSPPQRPSLWIEPPKSGSPLPVKSTVPNAVIANWHSETPLAAGLHVKETHLASAEVFETFNGDVPVANLAQGPTVVARPATDRSPNLAIIGFDPLASDLRFEVTTPLLFANLLHWLSPEALRTIDLSAARTGAATVTLDPNEQPTRIRVTYDDGSPVPFTVRNQTLQLFASHPGVVRILSDARERILSLTLPDVADRHWTPPASSASGLPAFRWAPSATDLWQFLAVLAAVLLFIEWLLFGRRRATRAVVRPSTSAAQMPARQAALEKELVGK